MIVQVVQSFPFVLFWGVLMSEGCISSFAHTKFTRFQDSYHLLLQNQDVYLEMTQMYASKHNDIIPKANCLLIWGYFKLQYQITIERNKVNIIRKLLMQDKLF